jgi:hypothetical protein
MKNNFAIVTGATAGIGFQVALDLAEKGFSLILIGRRKEKLSELQKLIEKKSKLKKPIQVHCFSLDLTNTKSVQAWAKENKKLIEKASVLINSAGLAKGVDKYQDSKWKDVETMIDTNIKGLMALTLEVLPYFVKNNEGHIVNLGSVAGRWVYPGGAVYCATKFSVRAFSEGLRQDLLGTRIRVTNIEPGMVNTEFSLVRLGNQTAADKVYENMTPLSAKDISETIIWAVQRPSHVNVQELVIYPTDQAHVGMVHRKK